jgi:malonyl-CoA O-methyltransferase
VHGFIDMHDLGDMLVAAGFAAPVMDTETITLTYPSVEAMVADLRGTGQTCSLAGRSRGLLGKGRWVRVRSALESVFREGRLPATIEVVYGHAWNPAPRRTRDGRAIVNLDPIRKM